MKRILMFFALMVLMLAFVSGQNTPLEFETDGDDTQSAVSDAQWIVQSFNVGTNAASPFSITNISLKGYRDNVGGILYVNLTEANSTGVPTPLTSLATGSFDYSTITNAAPGEWFNISLNHTVALEMGKNYSIIVTAQPAPDRFRWRGDSIQDYLFVGYTSVNNGATWTSNVEQMFIVFGTQDGLTTVLNAPPTSLNTVNSTLTFNATVTSQGASNITNATLFIWNSTNAVVNRTTVDLVSGTSTSNDSIIQGSIVDFGTYSWNILGCGETLTGSGSVCSFAPTNRTFTLGLRNDGEYFKDPTSEGSIDIFQVNLTIPSTSTLASVFLNHNGTLYATTLDLLFGTSYSATTSLTIPDYAVQTNVTFFWNVTFSSGFNTKTTNRSHIVNTIGFDDCTGNNLTVLNLSVWDEDGLFALNAPTYNSTVEIDWQVTPIGQSGIVSNFSATYTHVNSTAPAQVCVTPGALNTSSYYMDAQIKYSSTDRVVEFYNIQNYLLTNASEPQTISLYDLLTTNSQEFLITYKDSNFLPVSNALITITRKYVGEGIFRTVEVPITNVDGQALAHLVLGDEIYTIQVSKDGELLATFDNRVPFCVDLTTGDCEISLNSLSGGVATINFQTYGGLAYTSIWNRAARTLTIVYNTLDGTTITANLTGTLFDNFGNTTVCSSTLLASAGTINCVVPTTVVNGTVRAILYSNGNFVDSFMLDLSRDSREIFGLTGVVMTLIMFITIPLMFIASGAGIVIGAILGLIIATMLTLYSGGSIIGTASTIIWFIIAGAILIWKIANRQGGTA